MSSCLSIQNNHPPPLPTSIGNKSQGDVETVSGDGTLFERSYPPLLDCVVCIRDEFSQENFLIRVDGVDDQGQELRNLRLKLKRFARHFGDDV